jgi:hypothetical protein
MPVAGIRNDAQVQLLSADFQRRGEPNLAWMGAVGMFLALPCLRGFWPASSAGTAGELIDLSGQGRDLANVHVARFTFDDLAPCADLTATSAQWFTGAGGGFNVTGIETHVAPGAQGLTAGGWFRFDRAVGTMEYPMGKYATPANGSWFLRREASGALRATVVSGAALSNAWAGALAAGTWYWCALRFDPGNVLSAMVDLTIVDLPGAPASVDASATPFYIGTVGGGVGACMDGQFSFVFLCAAALSDAALSLIYEQTRGMFK